MTTLKVPNTPAPKATLCWKTPPIDGSQGHPMAHCDRKAGHKGLHSWQAASASVGEVTQDKERVRVLERAVGNCFMMAKRQIAAHLKGASVYQHDLERWQHVLRFCETTGSKSDILRGQLPDEITEGARVSPPHQIRAMLDDLVFARGSHLQWAEHLEAHAASGVACDKCDGKPFKLDATNEREWVAKYDRLLAFVQATDAALSTGKASTSRTSPQHRIRCGLQAMARALTAGHAWTAEARAGRRAASYAVAELPEVNAENPNVPTQTTEKE